MSISEYKPTIYLLILTWKDFLNTIRCAESVIKSVSDIKYLKLSIIIIDNNSNDESTKQLRFFVQSIKREHKNPRIELIENRENLGYAGGNNIGIKKALKEGANWIFILNNDTRLDPKFFEKIEQYLRDKKGQIIQPLIIESSNRNNERNVFFGQVKWLSSELEHVYQLRSNDINISTKYYAVGAAFLAKKEVFEKIGLLDSSYFLYFEDADFSIRAQRAGFKIISASNAIIKHRVSVSASKLGSARLLYYHFRNALYFNYKLGPWWTRALLYPWSLWILIKQIVKLTFGREREKSKMIISGISDFYKHKMGKLEK